MHAHAGRLRRRRAERGNLVLIVAIFSFVLIGSMAVAADLSVATHFKRNLQNVTDAAALAGAKELPATASLSGYEAATEAALVLVHNADPWSTSGAGWAQSLVAQGCAGSQCTVTVCAGTTLAGVACTATSGAGTTFPMVLTINVPPRTATVTQYDGDEHRVEVTMHQQSSAFFARIFGTSATIEGAESVAYHFAAGQPLPFALFSRTLVQSGNDGETIDGNIYASRFVAPQSNGHAGVCAGPDANGNPGYVVLGYPQQDDGSPPYTGDGQSSSRGDPVQQGATCPASGGTVAMSASVGSTSDCLGAYPGNNSDSVLTYDAADGACEADPPLQPPAVAALPNIPAYATSVCGAQGLVGSEYQPGAYSCATGPALTVDHTLAPGIYEIAAGANTGGCDVSMPGSVLTLTGVTFYLEGGAGICITIPSGETITQTPYNAGTGDPGDGRYIAVSDGVANPSITLTSGGGGSTSGVWDVTGVIWLPTGSVTINNKTALEDSGQVVVNSWNDQSGYHQNPAVSYNATLAPEQDETLQLSE